MLLHDEKESAVAPANIPPQAMPATSAHAPTDEQPAHHLFSFADMAASAYGHLLSAQPTKDTATGGHNIRDAASAVETSPEDVSADLGGKGPKKTPTPAPAPGATPAHAPPPGHDAAASSTHPTNAPPKITDKDRHAAEESRKGLSARIAKVGDVSADQQAQIMKRVQGLSGDALVQEMRTIEHALKGKNADRALATYAELDTLAKDPKAKERLSPEMVNMLVTGVADSRSSSDRGQAGILGARQARDSATALIDMSPEEYEKTKQTLEKAGKDEKGLPVVGADPAAEQALILKAVGARRDKFEHGLVQDAFDFVKGAVGIKSQSEEASADIDKFAKDIRGMKREQLIDNTTLIDVNDKNTSSIEPDSLSKKDDKKGDNDGLYQRFTTTCGPTTSQMVKGEADPIFALQVHKEGMNNPDPNSTTAQQQKKVLEDNGGVGVSRLGDQAKTQMDDKLGQLAKNKQITADQQTAIDHLVAGQKLDPDTQQKANAALALVRKANGGHPTDAELKAMQDNAGKTEAGMVLSPALNTIAGDSTHIDYATKGVSGTGVAGNEAQIDKLLKDGQQVPFRIAGSGNSGHFMMMSDVRKGADGKPMYLVSDPWSGATRWVPEADLSSGKFTTKEFDLGQAKITHLYADKTQTVD